MNFQGQGSFGAVAAEWPVDDLRGKRVRVSVQLKTHKTIAGWGRVWIDVQSPSTSDGLKTVDQRLWGQIDWSPYEISVDVPADATSFHYGALLAGSGQGWIDAFTLDIVDNTEPKPATNVAGTVVDAAGKPVPGALVAVVNSGTFEPELVTATAPSGAFNVSIIPGAAGITVTAPGYAAAYIAPEAATAREQTVRLDKVTHEVAGRLTLDTGGPLAGQRLGIQRISEDVADLFIVETDHDGVYRFGYGEACQVIVFTLDESLSQTQQRVTLDKPETKQDLTASLRQAAPDELITWLKANARPLRGATADLDHADLTPFGEFVGDARVVALGEASHGSREFFQMKHRLFRYLVEEKGFTAFAFELSLPEAELINDYVLYGEGDPKHALGAPFFWVYNTEEVLELVEWMRAYNAKPGREHKVQFLGFDMQFSEGADERLLAYLRRVTPTFAARARKPLRPLLERALTARNPDMTDAEKKQVADGLTAIAADLESNRAAYIAKTSATDWARARQYVRILEQLHALLTASSYMEKTTIRDRAMADNTLWHLAQLPKGARIALWAHNMHIQRVDMGPRPAQGRFLSDALGDDYRSLGFVFHKGAFQAYDLTGPEKDGRGVREFSIGSGAADDVGRNFARLGEPFFFLDLRGKPAGSRWLQTPRPQRSLGSGFQSDAKTTWPGVLANSYDGVVFVDTTTRARPLHDRGWRYQPSAH